MAAHLVDHGELAKVQPQPGLLRELALRPEDGEARLHLARAAGADDAPRVEDEHARARRREGELDGGEPRHENAARN